jgi:hypothetical protein
MRGSLPASTHAHPDMPHSSQVHCFRSNTRGGGAPSNPPSAAVILPAPSCRGTSTRGAALSLFAQSGHGQESWRCS